MSFANDLLGDTASNEMLEAMAPVRKHHDQIRRELFSNPHDIVVRRTASDINNELHFILEDFANYSSELGPGLFFPSRIGIDWKRNVHVVRGHSRDVQD